MYGGWHAFTPQLYVHRLKSNKTYFNFNKNFNKKNVHDCIIKNVNCAKAQIISLCKGGNRIFLKWNNCTFKQHLFIFHLSGGTTVTLRKTVIAVTTAQRTKERLCDKVTKASEKMWRFTEEARREEYSQKLCQPHCRNDSFWGMASQGNTWPWAAKMEMGWEG